MTVADRTAGKVRRTRRRRLKSIADELGPFARNHRRQLGLALVASLLLTIVQLAFPWPLKGIVELTLPEPQRTGWLSTVVPGAGPPMAWLAGALVLLGFAFGFSEFWQRLTVARFVVPTINDARLGILGRLLASSAPVESRRDPGDVLTRVIGDTAKLRVGMKGLLVHVLQHGLFVIGVCVVLLFVDARLGLAYLVGLLVAIGVALTGTDRTATISRKRRLSESRRVGKALRNAADSGSAAKTKDPGRERADALITQIKGRTAWAVQGVLALTAAIVLILAVNLAEAGRLSPGDVALVASYLLMLHYPVQRLGRQITRLGPQLTSAERLARLSESTHERTERP